MFFDSSATHALARSAERLQAGRVQLDVVCRTANLKRLFEITGVDRDLEVYATVGQANDLILAAMWRWCQGRHSKQWLPADMRSDPVEQRAF